MKKIKSIVFLIIIILLIVFIKTKFLLISVSGNSMSTTYNNGDRIIAVKTKKINRNDIVIANVNGTYVIKRVIGLPGEKLEYKKGTLYINEKVYSNDKYSKLTEDIIINENNEECYFILGDNRTDSNDSRNYGCINKTDIIAKVIVKLF